MKSIITIASQKGGVGKTTTVLNLAYSLSLLREDVLVLDCNPSGGVSLLANLKRKTDKGLTQVLKGESEPDAIVVRPYGGSLAMAGPGITDPDELLFFENEARYGNLAKLIKHYAQTFPRLIIDAPVGLGNVLENLLAVSTGYLVVANFRATSVKSFSSFFRFADWIKLGANPGLTLEGVLFTMYREAVTSEKTIFNHFRSRLPASFFFEVSIPFSPKYEMANLKSLPVALINDAKEAARPYILLATELNKRLVAGEAASSGLGPAAAEPLAGDGNRESGGPARNAVLEDVLADLCRKGGFSGALIADDMGLPLAASHLRRDPDALAAFATVLGEALKQAEAILDFKEAETVALAVDQAEKIILRAFKIAGGRHYLLVFAPLKAEPAPLLAEAISAISKALS